MQFLVIAYDFTDRDALNRRISAREKHILFSNELIKNDHMIFGVAILNENGEMVGSSCIYDFSSWNLKAKRKLKIFG